MTQRRGSEPPFRHLVRLTDQLARARTRAAKLCNRSSRLRLRVLKNRKITRSRTRNRDLTRALNTLSDQMRRNRHRIRVLTFARQQQITLLSQSYYTERLTHPMSYVQVGAAVHYPPVPEVAAQYAPMMAESTYEAHAGLLQHSYLHLSAAAPMMSSIPTYLGYYADGE